MLAILFCFSLQRIISGTTDFYGRSYKLSYILSGEPRWYYITVSDKSVHKEFPLIFTPEHFISPGFFYAFLNDKEYIPINKTNKVKIYPVQPSNKIAEDLKVFQGCKSVLVKAHSSFCQSDQYAYELVGDNLYVVKLKDGDIESLMNNNFVYSIHSIPDIAFQSNHAVGYVQSGQLDFTTDSHKVSFIPRVIHDLGYNGTGEIITITDSGIDVNSTFFKDPNHLVPFNETNPNHYKIYSYWTLTGEYTDYTGHGTHVSGIAAGWPYEGKMSNLSSYGGAAPGSKINFIDVVQRTDFIDSYTISIKLFEYMQKGDSYVSSNSFSLRGRFEGDNVYRNVYDNNSAYNNEYLYVCSAINDPSPNAITVPGSCRNILTVGSLARITTSTTYPSVASTSGRGPIQEGNIKPEVVAPGNSITSACNNHKDICVKSGTSMATPLVSGSILLLREYLKKNYNITRITNTLQRGLIIASADKKDPKTPDTAYGFGILNMSNLITELSNNTILFEDVQLMKDSQVLYEVNVLNNNSDLRIVFSYNDYTSLSILNFIVDLFVVTPNGKKLLPFYETEESYYSTNLRIFIPSDELEIGVYTIYLLTHKSEETLEKPNFVNGTIIALGNVNTLNQINIKDTKYNWNYLCESNTTNYTLTNGCKCKDNYVGIFCQHKVITLKQNKHYSFTLKPFESIYFTFNLTKMIKTFYLLLEPKSYIDRQLIYHLNKNNFSRFPNDYYFLGYLDISSSNKNFRLYSTEADFNSNDIIYFILTNDAQNDMSMEIEMGYDYNDDDDVKSSNKAILAIVLSISFVILFVLFIGLFCLISKNTYSSSSSSSQLKNEGVEDNYQTTNMPIYGYDNYDASYDQAIPPTYGSPTNNINYPEYAAMEDDLPPTTPVKKVMNK